MSFLKVVPVSKFCRYDDRTLNFESELRNLMVILHLLQP